MKYTDVQYNEENTLNAVDLENSHNNGSSGWVDHPSFPRSDWQVEVASGDSQVGYWDWVFNKIQGWEPDQDDADREAQYRQKAAAMYADTSSDNIEIEDNCAVSLAEEGAFVAAWVWVPESAL